MSQIVLKPYQIEANEQMTEIEEKTGMGGILAHSMGLGKSLSMANFLLNKQKYEGPKFPDLIVCPLSVLIQWKKEILRLNSSERVLIYHGSDRSLVDYQYYSFVICTYHCLVSRELEIVKWNRVVLDEAHIIRNGSESNYRNIPKKVIGAYNLKKNSKIRWCITGTPFNNRIEDVRSLMKFIGYSMNHDVKEFVDLCVLQKEKEGIIDPYSVHMVGVDKPVDKSVLNKYDKTLDTYHFFMQKLQVATPIEAPQVYIQAMNCLTQLRVFCDLMVPSVMKKVFSPCEENDEDGVEYYTKEVFSKADMLGFLDTSPKIQKVYENILEWIPKAPKKRILIFSSFVSTLNILECILNEKSKEIKTLKYIGSMNKEQRENSITEFCNEDTDEPMVMFISLGAGSCGINLVPCATVFVVDISLNPFDILQAVNRVHRLNQTSHVNVVKFFMKGMIESNILESHNKKIKVANKVGLKAELIEIN